MGVRFRDPGGEPYFSIGLAGAAGFWNATNHATLVNNAPAGAATTYGIAVDTSGAFLEVQLAANFATLIVSGRFYLGAGGFPGTAAIFQLFDSATLQSDVRIDATGHLFATRNGVVIGSSSSLNLIAGSGWHYFEMQMTINSATGIVQFWVDNVQYLNLSGLNTQNSGNATANRVRYGQSQATGASCYWKDMVILDTASGVRVARLGDVTVGVIYPNAAGANQAWTNNGGASQTASVQDGINHTGTWPDGDATYISSSTPNQISDFAHQALALTGSIFEIAHISYMRKDDSGSRVAKQVCISGATTEVSPDINLGNSYQYFIDSLEQDPNGAIDWTVVNFNNATFGVKEIS